MKLVVESNTQKIVFSVEGAAPMEQEFAASTAAHPLFRPNTVRVEIRDCMIYSITVLGPIVLKSGQDSRAQLGYRRWSRSRVAEIPAWLNRVVQIVQNSPGGDK